jgi:haloalkane dehalogenase
VDILRTPDSRFTDLDGYPFEPHYLDVTAAGAPPLRMHYIDEGPRDGSPVLLLHGEPTWSYLYRTMIGPLVAAGHRVLAPDLIGFGRSDKPARPEDYTYQRHVDWVTSWLTQLDVRDITAVVQDWGSLIGLRLAAENPERFAKLFIANGFLSTADRPASPAFKIWRAFARYTPIFSAGWLVNRATVNAVPASVRAGYDAPFPDKRYQAGARAFPQLVPTSPGDPAVPACRAAWDVLGRWEKPVLCVFGKNDPILGSADRPLIAHIPGAAGQPHARITGGHFIQEDAGRELVRHLLDWESRLGQ